LIALADRLDTLIGIFGINKAPTGEKDPFGLRRAAIGVIRLLTMDPSLKLPLKKLLERARENYLSQKKALSNASVVQDVFNFILERLKYWLTAQDYTANQFASVFAASSSNDDLSDFMSRMHAVREFLKLPEAARLSQANKRVANILTQAGVLADEGAVWENLLKESSEKALYQAILALEKNAHRDDTARLKTLASLDKPIDDFFEQVMVMVEDANLKRNRLALLSRLRALFLQIADISLL
jgi:glycyl-tRNA synthetase beta chain